MLRYDISTIIGSVIHLSALALCILVIAIALIRHAYLTFYFSLSTGTDNISASDRISFIVMLVFASPLSLFGAYWSAILLIDAFRSSDRRLLSSAPVSPIVFGKWPPRSNCSNGCFPGHGRPLDDIKLCKFTHL
jgi:hypothetical protein